MPACSHSAEGTRRDFLYVATATVAAVGAAATLVPLISQMNPDASTLAAGGPVDLDVGKIEPGQQVVIRWRQRPVFVFRRTPQGARDRVHAIAAVRFALAPNQRGSRGMRASHRHDKQIH